MIWGSCFWDEADRELLGGARAGVHGNQGAALLPGLYSPLKKVRMRIASSQESETHYGSLGGPVHRPLRAGRFGAPYQNRPDMFPLAFFRATAGSSELNPRFGGSRNVSNVVAADPFSPSAICANPQLAADFQRRVRAVAATEILLPR